MKLQALWQRWWVRVLTLWGATRALAYVLFMWVSSYQGASYWNGPHPAYLDLLNIWDAEWYHRIFDHGYPSILPANSDGSVQQNEWAFMPLYPFAVRAISFVTGLDWKTASAGFSLVVSFLLALALYKTFKLKFTAKVSLWAVVLYGLSPASPVLQTGYAETLGLLWLVLAIYWLIQHRYWASLPFMALLAFTRPGMIAFALMLGGMWLVRVVKAWRKQVEFPIKDQIQLIAVAAVAAVLGFAWSLVAWLVTGRADAYFATELAWRSWIGSGGKLTLLEPWFFMANYYFGVYGYIVLFGVFGFAAWLMFSKSVRQLGNEMRLWVASYFIYLFLVFLPQSSTFRILLPAFPLAVALAWRTEHSSRRLKVILIAAGIVMQMIWLNLCWYYESPDYTPP